MLSRRLTTATLALLCAATVAACSDDDDNPVGTGNANTTVRFFNATSGTFAFDVAQNGTVGTGNGNVAFGTSTSCMKVNNANPGLGIRAAGSTTNVPGFTPAFTANGTFTILVTGTGTAPVFTTLNDQFTAPTGTNAAVRIVNATTSATTGTGSWDIYVNPPATGTLGTPAATALGRNSASAYLTVPAAQANTIRLMNAGTTTGTPVLNIAVSSLTAGTVQTIVVTDAATAGGALRTFTLPACT